jgi:hypothetical protein
MKTVEIEWRRLVQGGKTHDVPPAWLIRQSVCRAAGCC